MTADRGACSVVINQCVTGRCSMGLNDKDYHISQALGWCLKRSILFQRTSVHAGVITYLHSLRSLHIPPSQARQHYCFCVEWAACPGQTETV